MNEGNKNEEPKIKKKKEKNAKLLFLLHGYGETGATMMQLEKWFQGILPSGSKIFYPNAPFKVNGGKGFHWFQFNFEDKPENIGASFNEEYIFKSLGMAFPYLKSYIDKTIEELDEEFSYKDIILCGFSQGAMMSLYSGVRLPEPICGIISCSGGILNSIGETENINRCPVCLTHGLKDRVVPYQLSQKCNERLLENGFDTELHLMPDVDHIISRETFDRIKSFVERICK